MSYLLFYKYSSLTEWFLRFFGPYVHALTGVLGGFVFNCFFSFFFSILPLNWRIESCLPVKAARICKIKSRISDRNRSPNKIQIRAELTTPKIVEDMQESDRLLSLFLAIAVEFFGMRSSLIRYSWIRDWFRFSHVLLCTHKHGIT